MMNCRSINVARCPLMMATVGMAVLTAAVATAAEDSPLIGPHHTSVEKNMKGFTHIIRGT